MTNEQLEQEVQYLRNMIDLMLINNAGIVELEGDYLDVFTNAKAVVDRRTSWAIHRKLRALEAGRIENEIEKLKSELERYKEDDQVQIKSR